MPLVYDDLFLICQEEVRLHSFLRDRGLLGDFTNLLCDLCGEGFIRLRRDRSFSRNGFVWRCSRTGKCHKKFSIRANSWFEKSKLDILTILKLTFYWLNRCTNEFVQNQLILGSKHTVVDWFNFAREVCATILFQTNEVLGGEGKVIEIDESKFGKRKYNRGRRVDGCWVFGGVERDSDKSFFVIVEDRTADTLIPLIQKFILPGTTIISDCWRSYHRLGSLGYTHLTVNHSVEFRDWCTHTNNRINLARTEIFPSSNWHAKDFIRRLFSRIRYQKEIFKTFG